MLAIWTEIRQPERGSKELTLISDPMSVVNHGLYAVLTPEMPETRLVSEGGETWLVTLKVV